MVVSVRASEQVRQRASCSLGTGSGVPARSRAQDPLEVPGEVRLVVADNTVYLSMFRQPVLVFEGTKEILTLAHGRALSRSLPTAVFTSDLFRTGNDRDNRAAVRAVGKDQLELAGMAVYGQRNAVDKVLKGARMHP